MARNESARCQKDERTGSWVQRGIATGRLSSSSSGWVSCLVRIEGKNCPLPPDVWVGDDPEVTWNGRKIGADIYTVISSPHFGPDRQHPVRRRRFLSFPNAGSCMTTGKSPNRQPARPISLSLSLSLSFRAYARSLYSPSLFVVRIFSIRLFFFVVFSYRCFSLPCGCHKRQPKYSFQLTLKMQNKIRVWSKKKE